MSTENEATPEAQLLNRHPQVRQAVGSNASFKEWQATLPKVVIDDQTFYVRGGDMLKDEDQIMMEWARRHRPDLLPDTDL